MTKIEETVDKTMTVAPGGEDEDRQPGDAGRDESIAKRMERDPESKEARLDRALDESMDASDPPASTQPVHNHRPAQSSGYDAEAEEKLRNGQKG